MSHKKILVLSATAGAGHVRAGEAIAETAQHLDLPVDVRHEDILSFTSPLFKRLYADVYNTIVQKSPELWGYLYKKSQFPGATQHKAPLIKLFDQFNYKKYLRALGQIKPDAVVCTHFLPYAGIADEMQKPSWRIPFVSVPTDYEVHSLWINPSITRYYAASEQAAWTIRSHGIDPARVCVTGIPVMPQFGEDVDRRIAAAEFGLSGRTLTIMVLSGGYGIGVIDKLVPMVAEFLGTFPRRKFQLIVVCGKNKKLFDTLSRHSFPANVSAKVFPFVSFVDKLMACSDLLITKSGGLTVSEALARRLPMMIFDPIPGQETYNADYLIENGAALHAGNFANLQFKLKQLIDRPAKLRKMSSCAAKLGKPHAAKNILEDLLQVLQ